MSRPTDAQLDKKYSPRSSSRGVWIWNTFCLEVKREGEGRTGVLGHGHVFVEGE